MAIVESLEVRKRICCGSMERELHISRKVVQELLKIPKALMERLTKWKIIIMIVIITINKRKNTFKCSIHSWTWIGPSSQTLTIAQAR